MKEYKLKQKKGIDDLLCEFAFRGNSQGDESTSNNIEDYKASEGWMSPVFKNIDITNQEAINKEVIRRKKLNEEYISKLKEEGKFGEEYEINIHLKENPLFDKKEVLFVNKLPLESYKLVFIDKSKVNESK